MNYLTATDNADADVPMDTTQANTSNLDNSKTTSTRNGKSNYIDDYYCAILNI